MANDNGVSDSLDKDGFYIDVVEGDVVNTGNGPDQVIPIPTTMWVPRGSTLNGNILLSADDAIR